MTFPQLSKVARTGEVRCGSVPYPGGPPCGALAAWHVAWHLRTPADFSLVCDKHMVGVQQQLAYVDRHPASVDCDMPGTGWLSGDPSRCVPASTDDVAAEGQRGER